MFRKWDHRKIDGRWCVGMEGNLDTRHDAVLVVNSHAGDAEAEALARRVADLLNAAEVPH